MKMTTRFLSLVLALVLLLGMTSTALAAKTIYDTPVTVKMDADKKSGNIIFAVWRNGTQWFRRDLKTSDVPTEFTLFVRNQNNMPYIAFESNGRTVLVAMLKTDTITFDGDFATLLVDDTWKGATDGITFKGDAATIGTPDADKLTELRKMAGYNKDQRSKAGISYSYVKFEKPGADTQAPAQVQPKAEVRHSFQFSTTVYYEEVWLTLYTISLTHNDETTFVNSFDSFPGTSGQVICSECGQTIPWSQAWHPI